MARQWFWPTENGWRVWNRDDSLADCVFPVGSAAFLPAFLNQFVSWWRYLFVEGATGSTHFFGNGSYVLHSGFFKDFAGASKTTATSWSVSSGIHGHDADFWMNLDPALLVADSIITASVFGGFTTATVPRFAAGTEIQMNSSAMRSALVDLRRALDNFVARVYYGADRNIYDENRYDNIELALRSGKTDANGHYSAIDQIGAWYQLAGAWMHPFHDFQMYTVWGRTRSAGYQTLSKDALSYVPYKYILPDSLKDYGKVAIAYGHDQSLHWGIWGLGTHYTAHGITAPDIQDGGARIWHVGTFGREQHMHNGRWEWYKSCGFPYNERPPAVEEPSDPPSEEAESLDEYCTLVPVFIGIPNDDVPAAAYRPSTYGLPEVPYNVP